MLSDEFLEETTGVRSPTSLGGTTASVSLRSTTPTGGSSARSTRARPIRPLKDEFYGCSGKLRDPYGHTWGILGPAKSGTAPA